MADLHIQSVSKRFGGLAVLEGVDLEVPSGARHAIIGPNGAGKTTLFNLISGWLAPTSGAVLVDGRDVAGMGPVAVSRNGLARSFQKNTLLEGVSVLENLRIAVQAHSPGRFNFLKPTRAYGDLVTQAEAVAVQMRLEPVLDREVRALSYGQKRQLEVGIALASSPSILLLDEPAAGTSPAERHLLIDILGGLPSELTLLLVEHDMDVVFGLCGQVSVLNYGVVVATDTPDAIRRNRDVQAAYLGETADHEGAP